MATLITKHVKADGTKDYTTVQAAEDAMGANLVTADEQWDIYIWGEIVETGFNVKSVSFSTHGTDSTRYWRILNNPGEGPFASDAVALKYNASNGAALKNTGGGSSNVVIYVLSGNDYFVVSGIQCYTDSTACLLSDSCGGFSFDKVLAQCATSTSSYCLSLYHFTSAAASTVQRFVFVQDHSGTPDGCVQFQGSSQQNVTLRHGLIIRPTNRTAGGTAIYCRGTNQTVKNVAMYGYTTQFGGTTGGFTASYNATDDTSFEIGTNSIVSTDGVVADDDIETPSTATAPDFRLQAGSVLIGAGIADLSTDCYGSTYASPPAIGPMEELGGGGGPVVPALDEGMLVGGMMPMGGGME